MKFPLPWTAGHARGMTLPAADAAPSTPRAESHGQGIPPRARTALHSRSLACTVIVVVGLLLPFLVLLITWAGFAVVEPGSRTAQRLWSLLTPSDLQLSGAVWLALLQALPFLVLAAVAWGRLSPLNPWWRRTAWRIGGAFVGLCLGVVFTYGIVVPLMHQWRSPGLDAPPSLLAVLYSACLIGALIGRAIGRVWAHRAVPPHSRGG